MKVGVIGTGHMGENHVRTYLSLNDHCQFIGIYDHDRTKGKQIAEAYQVTQFHTLPDLLQSVDAVSIVVPTEFHYDIGLTCIKNRVHMLMEKPITSTVAQAEDLHKRAKDAGIILQVGHIELFNPFIQLLMQEVEQERIIGVAFQRMSLYDERMQKVDVVKDLMIHDLYILHELLREQMVDIHAIGSVLENTPTHAAAIIHSSSGVTAQLTASFQAKRKKRTIQILTDRTFIEADILNNELKQTYSIQEKTSESDIAITKNLQIDHAAQPLTIQLLDFLYRIRSGSAPAVTGMDGADVLRLTNEISETIQRLPR